MKRTSLIIAMAFLVTSTIAQKKTTTSATIMFDATTSKDALPKAENKTVVAAIDPKNGSVAFEASIRNFNFTNPMIQDHFNGEKWMNSDKFPTAVFKGKLSNLSDINFKKDGTYTAEVSGELTMHGVTKPVTSKGSIVISGKNITATSAFTVKLADYGINGGAIAAGKVAEEPTITVNASF